MPKYNKSTKTKHSYRGKKPKTHFFYECQLSNARLQSITLYNNECGDHNKGSSQEITLQFNNNASLRDFFMLCPTDWHKLERFGDHYPFKELYPEHEKQIDIDKDVTTIERGRFWITIRDSEDDYHIKGSAPRLSYCEADEHIQFLGDRTAFTMTINREENKRMLKQLFDVAKQFEQLDNGMIQTLSSQLLTIDDIIELANKDGVGVAIKHAKESVHEDYLLCRLADYYFSLSPEIKTDSYKNVKQCVDALASSFHTENCFVKDTLKKMNAVDRLKYNFKVSTDEYETYYLISLHKRQFKARYGNHAKLFSNPTPSESTKPQEKLRF